MTSPKLYDTTGKAAWLSSLIHAGGRQILAAAGADKPSVADCRAACDGARAALEQGIQDTEDYCRRLRVYRGKWERSHSLRVALADARYFANDLQECAGEAEELSGDYIEMLIERGLSMKDRDHAYRLAHASDPDEPGIPCQPAYADENDSERWRAGIVMGPPPVEPVTASRSPGMA
jgi:hypothetical protein